MEREIRILILEDVPTDAELAERELRKAGIPSQRGARIRRRLSWTGSGTSGRTPSWLTMPCRGSTPWKPFVWRVMRGPTRRSSL